MTETNLVFIGICERAYYVHEEHINIKKWNIAGLKNIILSHIFPFTLNGFHLGFAISMGCLGKKLAVKLIDTSGKEVAKINMSLERTSPDAENYQLNHPTPTITGFEQGGYLVIFTSVNDMEIVIEKPGDYYFQIDTNGKPKTIGHIHFAVIDPMPLTPERVTAIRSEPNAVKAVRMQLGCKFCTPKCRVYAALERDDELEEEGWQWYENLPDEFICECGKSVIDLRILRQNLHGLLGDAFRDSQELSFMPLYEKSALKTTRMKYRALLDSEPKEEILQSFIKENPVLLHQFPSRLIFSKPPILTFHVADFGIVTPQNELILVEIEKATTRLLKKDGGIAAQLNHAFDQVRDWLHVMKEHRLAALDAMKIDSKEVSTVRGVVIAGRESGYDAQKLRKLKGSDFGDIIFLTYDDLLYSLDALIDRLERM